MVTQTIRPGDKIATWKDAVFLHPMIHIRDGWCVEKAKTGLIRPRHLSTVPNGRVRLMQRPRPEEAPRVVERAISRLGREPYDPLTANCQHFANEVLTGESRSEQVDLLKCGAVLAIGVAVLAALAGG